MSADYHCTVGADGAKYYFHRGKRVSAKDVPPAILDACTPTVGISSAHVNQCLQFNGAKQPLAFAPCLATSTDQQWMVDSDGFVKTGQDHGMCLDSYEVNTAPYAWPCNGNPNQRWQLPVPGGGKAFTVYNKKLNQALDIWDPAQPQLTQYPLSHSANQEFKYLVAPTITQNKPVGYIPPTPWTTLAVVGSASALKNTFIDYVRQNMARNGDVPAKSADVLRVATFNVHYWKDTFEKANDAAIWSTIQAVNADILCLQEVSMREDFMSKANAAGYARSFFCETATLFHAPFGNTILTKAPAIQEEENQLLGVFNNEDRCYTRIVVPRPQRSAFAVYNIHLDVFDDSEATRVAQIQLLLARIRTDPLPVIVCGDFNSISRADYPPAVWNWILQTDASRKIATQTKAQDLLRSSGLTSIFTLLQRPPPPSTVWPGRQVDFIFLDAKWNPNDILGAYPYFSPASDHLPLIVDLAN